MLMPGGVGTHLAEHLQGNLGPLGFLGDFVVLFWAQPHHVCTVVWALQVKIK
jgi:hypothetical protein